MKRTRSVLAAALLLAAVPVYGQTVPAGQAPAAGPAPSVAPTAVAGDWEVTILSPQGASTLRVTLTQDGDKVSGVLKSPQGELPFEGGTLTGSDLKFAFSVPFQGAPLEITLTGKVDGPSVAGKADFGGLAEGDWSARKIDPAAAAAMATAAASAPASPASAPADPAGAAAGLTGKWEITMRTQMGDVPVAAEFVDAGGTVTGTLVGPSGPLDVTGTFDGSAVVLSFTARTPNGDIPVKMTGDVTGDSIAGKADFGGMGNGEWSARRARP